MEDIMKALLDVVRAQHSATEGSEEKPFDINDIIDMAMNITGRPEEPAEQRELQIRFRRWQNQWLQIFFLQRHLRRWMILREQLPQ